jgi:hypothetical protein
VEQGVLQLTLAWNGKQVVAAGIVSTRPALQPLLRGLPAARVSEFIPRLFSLCRCAQETAARLSLQAARGETAVIDAAGQPGLAVAFEAIGEHLWRLLLDWPTLCGEAARQSEFIAWRRQLAGVVDQDSAAALGARLLAWLDQELPPRVDDDAAVDHVALLPQLPAAAWAKHLTAGSAPELPTFAGQPAESGVLARRAGDGAVAALLAAGQRLRARLSAQYADLRWLAQGLLDRSPLSTWLDAAAVTEGCGVARVETARGTLLHRIQLDGERVGRYLIVAPTDWNFHPQGAFAREICGRVAATQDDARIAAARLALSLNPCVAYEISVEHA